jgi:hypothetical protein
MYKFTIRGKFVKSAYNKEKEYPEGGMHHGKKKAPAPCAGIQGSTGPAEKSSNGKPGIPG